jgi:cholesterol transport system auxiliary component
VRLFVWSSGGLRRAESRFTFWPALGLTLALAACNGDGPMPNFDLSPAYVSTRRPLPAQLVVREPLGPLVLDSQRILVRSGPDTLAYLSDAQWSERLPALVRERLVQTFQNAHLLRAEPGGDAPPDYSLELEIRHFELDATSRQGVVEIAAKIVKTRDGLIVAERSFKSAAPAAGTTGPQATAALNKALSDVMAEIVAFAAAKV